nr:nonstructural protein NS2B [Cacipacore virus]
SWPASEVFTAIGITFALVGGILECEPHTMAVPMVIAGIMGTAYVISGRHTDMWLEKAADISWELDAEVTGSSPRLDVTLDDDGNFNLIDDPGTPWKLWMMRMACLTVGAFSPWAILPSLFAYWMTIKFTKRS